MKKILVAKELEILFLQAQILFPPSLTSAQNLICYYHYAALISKYESKQRHCCNHLILIKLLIFGRKVISSDLAKQLKKHQVWLQTC